MRKKTKEMKVISKLMNCSECGFIVQYNQSVKIII